MNVTIDRLFADPSLYLHSIDGDHVRFVELTRDEFRQSIFFDRRIVRANDVIYRIPLPLLLELAQDRFAEAPRLNFIHHVAQCGSTLLARALDVGSSLGIREPFALRQLAVQAGTRAPAGGDWPALLSLVLGMLGKRFDAAAPVVIKGNVPISMVGAQVDAVDPGQAGILLHFPLDDYLAAVLRTENHGQWVDSVTAELRLGQDPLVGSIEGLSTAEKAAALWLSLVSRYARLLDINPNMRSLDANVLFDRPAAAIEASARLFGLRMEGEEAEAIAAGPLFHSYGKNPEQPYDPAQRVDRREATRRDHAEDFAAARRWIEGRLAEVAIPEALDRPLLGGAARLL